MGLGFKVDRGCPAPIMLLWVSKLVSFLGNRLHEVVHLVFHPHQHSFSGVRFGMMLNFTQCTSQQSILSFVVFFLRATKLKSGVPLPFLT